MFDWIHGAKMWQMCSSCDVSIDCGCVMPVASIKEKENADCGLIGSGTQLAAATSLCRSSTLGLVYKRRKLTNIPVQSPPVLAYENSSSCRRNLVYQRRKLHKNLVYRRRKHLINPTTSFLAQLLQKMSPSIESMGACTPFAESVNPGLAKAKNTVLLDIRETEAFRSSSQSAVMNVPTLRSSGTNAECLVEVRDSDGKDKMSRAVGMCSIGDSCSSSMLNMDIDSTYLKIESDDTGECSSSGTLEEALGEDLSEKDLCILILRSHGLLSEWRQNSSPASVEDATPSTGLSSSLSCTSCSYSEATGNMLICDHCEAAFHLSCCNPSVKKVPTDEWYCQSCSNKRHITMKESKGKMTPIINSKKGSNATVSEGEPGSIASLLADTRPYTTGVRIGKAFQAAVPDWCGPITEATDPVSEPMELDLSETLSLPLGSSFPVKKNLRKLPNSSSIGNWLQCREVIAGLGDGRDGVTCGKWRRAPLSEVQTDDWECFRSILWDPSHADCAVPQELEIDEVLKQLKYMKMLKPRLNGRRRRSSVAGVNGCRGRVMYKS